MTTIEPVHAEPLGTDLQDLLSALLDGIKEGRVIPIIGPELARVPYEAGGVRRAVTLDQYLAIRVAAHFHITLPPLPASPDEPLPPDFTLARVAARGRDRLPQVAQFLNALLANETFPTPEPLRKLARIRPLKLFVTTTFDDLLRRAIEEVRPNGPPPAVLRYAPDCALQDLPADPDEPIAPTVYHLFGRVSPRARDFVITEEDTLDFTHALQSSYRPGKLFERLGTRDLLFIGCQFPDWLARFVLRTARKERLSNRERFIEVVADSWAFQDPNLTLFLQSFGHTRVFPRDAATFVETLFALWEKRYPGDVLREGVAPEPEEDAKDWVPGSVFVSYASQDLDEATRIFDGLYPADVWMDKDRLKASERWRDVLRRSIAECGVFMPVLSARAAKRIDDDAVFRREWAQAIERVEREGDRAPAILPVIVDDLPIDAAGIPAAFWELQTKRVPGGHVDRDFKKYVAELQRSYRARHPGRR